MLFCQNAMLEVFPCLSCVDQKKIDRIASVIVIKSRKSKGYAIADTDCTCNVCVVCHTVSSCFMLLNVVPLKALF